MVLNATLLYSTLRPPCIDKQSVYVCVCVSLMELWCKHMKTVARLMTVPERVIELGWETLLPSGLKCNYRQISQTPQSALATPWWQSHPISLDESHCNEFNARSSQNESQRKSSAPPGMARALTRLWAQVLLCQTWTGRDPKTLRTGYYFIWVIVSCWLGGNIQTLVRDETGKGLSYEVGKWIIGVQSFLTTLVYSCSF